MKCNDNEIEELVNNIKKYEGDLKPMAEEILRVFLMGEKIWTITAEEIGIDEEYWDYASDVEDSEESIESEQILNVISDSNKVWKNYLSSNGSYFIGYGTIAYTSTEYFKIKTVEKKYNKVIETEIIEPRIISFKNSDDFKEIMCLLGVWVDILQLSHNIREKCGLI